MTATTAPEKFVPLHEDHSIQSVGFGLGLDAHLRKEDLVAVRQAHDLWRDELPATSDTPPGVEFDGTTAKPTAPGIQFAYLRPDGSPAWLLQLIQNQITVECARYSRWERVWGAAGSYLSKVLGVVGSSNQSLKVVGLTLQVIDEFRVKQKDYALEHLIAHGTPFIAQHAYSSGAVWHSHHGWFVYEGGSDDPFVLNTLNVDSRRLEHADKIRQDPDDAHSVCITHVQQLRLRTPISPADAARRLTSDMSNLHSKNKALLGGLLVEPIRKRISLGAP